MEMPHKTETFKFKDHAATEKCPFTAYLDFESSLLEFGMGKILREHNLVAGFYVILNKEEEIVAWDLFFVSENSSKEQHMHDLSILF